jgi:Zn ribbon nucleic-acid-binding protein
MSPTPGRSCPQCGRETSALRDGVCVACWYQSRDRPKPVRDRFAKLERLREQGIEPYAYSYDPSHELVDAVAAFEVHEAEGTEDDPDPVRVAGRVLSLRDLGGIGAADCRSISSGTSWTSRLGSSWTSSIWATGSA